MTIPVVLYHDISLAPRKNCCGYDRSPKTVFVSGGGLHCISILDYAS